MVSVIIPSIRLANLVITVEKFIKSQRDADFQLVIVADFQYAGNFYIGDRVEWIYCPKREGPNVAINDGLNFANGDYIFFINDQCSLSKGGLKKMVEFSKKHNDNIIVSHRNFPISPLSYYGVEFEPYPLVHKSIIKKLGGFYLPKYNSFYADPDFAMRSYEAGIKIKKCPHVCVRRTCDGSMDYQGHSENVNKYYKQDMETFIKTWGVKGFKEIAPGRRSWLWCRFLELLPY